MVSKKYILDSSVLIAYFNKKDSQYHKAELLFDKIKPQSPTLIIPILVLVETLTVLKQKLTHPEFTYYIKVLLDQNMFYVDNSYYFDQSAAFFNIFSKKNKISFIDSFLIDYSKSQKLPLLTFDQAINKYLV